MQPLYSNSLSLSPDAKDIPYVAGNSRTDGHQNYGFKNLVVNPILIDSIPELAVDPALKSLVKSLNSGRFLTTGCFSEAVSTEQGYQHRGYIEFAWNCKVCVRDAINYFSLFFHFDQFLYQQKFECRLKFHWVIEEAQFRDIDMAGFCCAVYVSTAYYSTSHQSCNVWQFGLETLAGFLGSIQGQSATVIYGTV